jgi:hypothetical protein
MKIEDDRTMITNGRAARPREDQAGRLTRQDNQCLGIQPSH